MLTVVAISFTITVTKLDTKTSYIVHTYNGFSAIWRVCLYANLVKILMNDIFLRNQLQVKLLMWNYFTKVYKR